LSNKSLNKKEKIMALKRNKPTTPSKRHLIQLVRSDLLKTKPIRSKTYGLNKKGGRNHYGRITSFHRGGGHKRCFRIIDFKRLPGSAKVLGYEYDPNRSAWIARVCDEETQQEFYIIAPKGLSKDTVIVSGKQADIKPGNHILLENMPIGTSIHNIEMKPGKGGQLIRSAGCSGSLIQKTDCYARVRLPSGIQRLVPLKCSATVGSVSNSDFKIQTIGKAGRSRWLSRRPKVRGVAMNPVDHPHGGGEGKTSGGRPSVTPWGRPTKGQPTRSKRKRNKLILGY
jgi:large subunit ribosomal protein L2